MKLTLNNGYNRSKMHYSKNMQIQTPIHSINTGFNKYNNDTSFTSLAAAASSGKFQKIVSESALTTYTNISSISENIDKILGNDFFKNTLKKANLIVDESKNQLQIENSNIFIDILRTLKYPFLDLPRDLTNCLFTNLKKVKPLENFADGVLKTPVLKNRADRVFQERNRNLALEILETFSNKNLGAKTNTKGVTEYSINKCTTYFREKTADQVTKTAPNYSARDERTLNRLATGTVSSIYGGWDFYNISMLQKDDKKEARKAQKSRFKQEMSRILISASMTFATLGIFHKYIKNSLGLNIAAIALSTLIADVGSRVFNRIPLLPLTPVQAANLAEKTKQNSNKNENEKQASENKAKQMPMKGSLKEEQLFDKFLSDKGASRPLELLLMGEQTIDKNIAPKKKKITIRQSLLGAFGLATMAYLLGAVFKGEFKFNQEIKKIYDENSDKINEFLNGMTDKLDGDVLKKITEQEEIFKRRSDSVDIFSKIRKLLTTMNKKVDLPSLKDKLEILKQNPEGSEISDILDKYIDYINSSDKQILKVPKNIPVVSGVYNGFSRIFKTAYQAFSLPGLGIKEVINHILFKDSETAYKKIKVSNFEGKIKQQILILDEIVKKCMKNSDDTEGVNKAINLIKKNIRNVSDNPETGELANYARTCVTVISSYFFINDYRNRVLIESKGKDIEKAEEEKNQRLAHKLANFVVNGTLMNLFNSVFKGPLNSGLLPATIIATSTEATNEFLVRHLINQPILPKNSKQEIIDYEEKQESKKGIAGSWSKFYRKLTGKKSLTEKVGVKADKNKSKQ